MNKLMLNNEWGKMFAGLPDEKAGQLIKAVFACHSGEPVDVDDPVLAAVYSMIEDVVVKNREAYEETCERNAKNGSKGGRPKNPEKPTETQSVSEKPSRFSENPEKANRKEKKGKEKNIKDNKLPFGEYGYVRMSAKEYEKLSEEFGQERTDQAVKYLDEYIGDKGYKSKSHYLAIRRWVFDAIDEKKQKPPNRRPPGTKFQNFPARQDQEHKDLVAKLIAMDAGG